MASWSGRGDQRESTKTSPPADADVAADAEVARVPGKHANSDLLGTGRAGPMPDEPGKRAATELLPFSSTGGAQPFGVQHKADDAAPAAAAVAGAPQVLVDDGALASGQQLKSAFLAGLKPTLEAAAAAELGFLWATAGCPYIAHYLALYEQRTARETEAFIRRYAGSGAATADALAAALVARVRVGVKRWRETGEMPPELGAATAAAATPVAAAAAGPQVQHKREDGAPTAVQGTAEHVLSQLGDGSPLDGATAGRMSEAFGASFADVRIHADAHGGALAQQQGALAFTVGSHIAFAPGRYAPGTPTGDALLAHELTHVLQQSGAAPKGGAIGGSSSAEHDADQGATAAVKRLHGGTGDRASVQSRSDFQLQRCGGESTPSPAGKQLIPSPKQPGKYEGMPMAEAAEFNQGKLIYVPVYAERTLGFVDSEAAAVALVKTNGSGGSVTLEDGKYVAYFTSGVSRPGASGGGLSVDSMKLAPWTAVLISNEQTELRPGMYDPKATKPVDGTDRQQLDATGDPYAGYKEALGGEKGNLNTVDDPKLVQAFESALKDTALVTLNRGAAELKKKQERFGRPNGEGISPTELETIQSVAGELATLDEKIKAKESEVSALQLGAAAENQGDGLGHPMRQHNFDAPLRAARADLANLQAERRTSVAKYPLLSRVDPAKLKTAKPGQIATTLGGEIPGILTDIEKTRQNVANGAIELWGVDAVVNATIAGFGLTDAKRQMILDHKAKLEKEKTITTVVTTVFMVAFGLLATFATGGVAAVAAAGAFGLGMYDAIKQTEEYTVNKPGSNTGEDKDAGLTNAPPGWGWLVVAWVGVGLDAMQVAHALEPLAKGRGAIKTVAEDLARQNAKRLGMSEQDLVAKLRRLAGDASVTTPITEAEKGIVATRLGVAIDIDPALVGDVRVAYTIEKDGRVVVTGLKVGPEAKVAEVLAHQKVITLMQSYEAETTKIQQLWNKMRSFVGAGPDVNPFPKGSQAWEAWFEVKKLPDIAAARLAKYGGVVRAGNEAELANDVEVLASELKRNQALIDEVVLEKGVGFVGKTGDSTRAAVAKGYPLCDGCKTADEMLAKGYYYRLAPDGEKFQLARKAEADIPPLQVEFQAGKPVKLVPGGEMTRAEKAAALLKEFPEAKQEAFEVLQKAQEALGNKVVPIKGVHITSESIGKLAAESGVADFSKRLQSILKRAYMRKGLTEAAAEAKALEGAKAVAAHPITVVQGTDQLRAFGYRAAYMRGMSAEAAQNVDDLHHMIPLYLGGDHTTLIDVAEDLHGDLHALIDDIHWDRVNTSLAPSGVQNAALDFQQGAAILYKDGTIEYKVLGEAPKPK